MRTTAVETGGDAYKVGIDLLCLSASQEIGCEVHVLNDLFHISWDVKP